MKRYLVGFIFGLYFLSAHANFFEGVEAEKRGDYDAAIQDYLPLAEAGKTSAQINLGFIYLYHRKDYGKSFYWYSEAAKKNAPKALESLGVIYMNGYGVDMDFYKAAEFFKKGAKLGDDSAMENLSLAFLHGRGVPQNVNKGLMLLRQSAQQGNKEAWYNLGVYYADGRFVAKDMVRGVGYFKSSAIRGFVPAMTILGFLYEVGDGPGLLPNKQQAIYWFSKAADLGSAEARDALGRLREKL